MVLVSSKTPTLLLFTVTFELTFAPECQRDRKRTFNINQSATRMVAGKLCALWTTVFSKTFCYAGSASDVNCAVRASEDVDKGVSAYWRRRFPCREI